MTEEELIALSDLNREDNIKYISSEAQGIAITLDSDRYAPTFCKLERAYICGRRKSEEQIEELEKENAELKSENQKWKDEWQEQVQKANDEGYARTLQTMQLTKAKEILKSLYFIIESRIDYKNNIGIADEMWRAKQFWSEEK